MKKLVILLAVLAFCLPAYAGDPNAVGVLVYKVKGNLKGIDLTDDVVGKIKINAYLVLDVNYSDANAVVVTDDVVVVYGNDADGTYAELSLNNVIVGGDGEFVQSPISGKIGWGIEGDGATAGSAWLAVVGGKAKASDIGLAADQIVAKSMKGAIIANGTLSHYGNDVIAYGKIKLKLDKKFTIAANEADMTMAEVQTEILLDLPSKPKI